jgi:transposase-like protein
MVKENLGLLLAVFRWGLIRHIQKELYEALLNGELTHHLGDEKHEDSIGENYHNGYSEKTLKTQHGEVTLNIPRDRKGSFEPMIVVKNQRRLTVIDEAVISPYGKDMSLSQISESVVNFVCERVEGKI